MVLHWNRDRLLDAISIAECSDCQNIASLDLRSYQNHNLVITLCDRDIFKIGLPLQRLIGRVRWRYVGSYKEWLPRVCNILITMELQRLHRMLLDIVRIHGECSHNHDYRHYNARNRLLAPGPGLYDAQYIIATILLLANSNPPFRPRIQLNLLNQICSLFRSQIVVQDGIYLALPFTIDTPSLDLPQDLIQAIILGYSGTIPFRHTYHLKVVFIPFFLIRSTNAYLPLEM